MKPTTTEHLTSAALLAYGQGRLGAAEMTAVETHLAECATCSDALASTPDDTLLLRAREAATSGFRAKEQTVATKPANPREIPQPLREHSRYRVLGLLGAGGMGAVYKAEHRLMERMVALKVINPALVSSPAALERFEREVKAAAKLSHANIVTAHDAEQAGDLHYLVMEFVDGVSLDRLLAKKGPLPPQQAAHLIRQAALGLQHAHDKGMIHRDIKPQNLMVTRDGVLKILDFGLARLATQAWQSSPEVVDSPDRPENATRAGAVLGTPDYIAPEQATDAHQADIRADIYSLGCTLYFLLTGEPPFAGGTMLDKLHAHQTCEPTPIRLRRPEVPEELANILERMLAKKPADRYARPADLAAALAPLVKSRPSASGAAAASKQPKVPVNPAPTIAAEPEAALPALETLDFDALIPESQGVILKSLPASRFDSKKKITPLIWGGGIAAAVALVGVVSLIIAASGNNSPTPNKGSQPPVDVADCSGGETKQNSVQQVPPPATGKQQVLMILPQTYLYYPDYENVRQALPSSVQLKTAALYRDPVGFAKGGEAPSPLTPDLALSADVKAKDYAAIIFVGFKSDELCMPGPGRTHIARLLGEFEREKKPITALCAGQYVLASHGLLKQGREVAGGQYAEMMPEFKNCGAAKRGWGVVVDEQIITGAAADDGPEFARTLATAIGAR